MKTYEEMAQNVLTRIEEYEIEKQNKHQKIRKAAIMSVPLCMAVIAAAGVFRLGIIGNNNKVPVTEPEKSVVSSVSENEIKDDSSSNDSSVSYKENTVSEFASSEKKSSSQETNSNQKTESTAADNTPHDDTGGESISTSEEDDASSAAECTPNHESGNDTETASSQTVSTADEEDNTAPEHSFEYVHDALGMMYYNGVIYMQFSVYDDGFTLDKNIGAASDFDGYYKYIKDVTGEVYTVKESPDVLIVKLSNGGTVALAKAGQLIVNGTPYCSTMLDTNVYLADQFIGYVSDFETVNVPYFNYEIELSPNDEVYTVVDKDEGTLCIKQENGNAVIFVSMW